MTDYTIKPLNVFVNGNVIPRELWDVNEAGALEFAKPLAEIAPKAKPDPDTGKPVYWIVFEYECL